MCQVLLTISYILSKYISRVNETTLMPMPEITPHCLRHSKAMHLVEAGKNLVYIRDFLGHESIETTQIYAKANPESRRQALETVNTLPFRSVASFRFGLSVVAFVSLVLGSLVILAVPAFSKPGATGVSTWFLGLSGHRDYHSLLFCYAQLRFEPSKLLAESKVGVSSLFIYSPRIWGL